MMVLAIFLYVGAEVCVSSGAPLYLKDRFGVDINKVGLLGTGLFFLALTIGRFSGGVILNWLKPKVFFAITCVLSVVGLLGLFIPSGTVAVISFFLVGLGFANIFPLVFSITIDRMPEHTNALVRPDGDGDCRRRFCATPDGLAGGCLRLRPDGLPRAADGGPVHLVGGFDEFPEGAGSGVAATWGRYRWNSAKTRASY